MGVSAGISSAVLFCSLLNPVLPLLTFSWSRYFKCPNRNRILYIDEFFHLDDTLDVTEEGEEDLATNAGAAAGGGVDGAGLSTLPSATLPAPTPALDTASVSLALANHLNPYQTNAHTSTAPDTKASSMLAHCFKVRSLSICLSWFVSHTQYTLCG